MAKKKKVVVPVPERVFAIINSEGQINSTGRESGFAMVFEDEREFEYVRKDLVLSPKLRKALGAWFVDYKARIKRLQKKSKEDYSGVEQDLFDALSREGIA